MSHFSVTVIGPNPESQLAPFQENNMGDCPKEYLEFHDVEEKYHKEFVEDGTEMVEMEDGTLAYTWDDRFKVHGPDIFSSKTEVPAHLTKRFVKHLERYASFDEFISDWAGYEKDEVLGRYGYWENPNAKWDYHRLGGRWRGQFRLKKEFAGKYGIPEKSWEWTFDKESLDSSHAKDDGCWVDQALKGEIDWEYMRNQGGNLAAKSYDFAMSFLNHLPANKTWDEVRDEVGDIERAHEIYWGQERCVAWKKAQKDTPSKDWPFSWLDGSPDDFLVSRESYVETARNSAVTTFALVKDSKWAERGSMGWFGCVSGEKDQETWSAMYWKIIDGLSDDTLLSCFDCHI